MDHLLLDKAVDSFIIKPSKQARLWAILAGRRLKTSYIRRTAGAARREPGNVR